MRPLVTALLLLAATAARAVSFPETAVADPSYFRATSPQLRLGAAAAAGRSSFLVAWEERASLSKPSTIVVRALDADGTPRQPIAVAIGSGQTPAIAWNGTDYLVVWAHGKQIETERVSESGVAFEATHNVLTTNAGGRPAVASHGYNSVVTWGDGAALLDHYGAVIQALPAGGAVAALGSDFLIASGGSVRSLNTGATVNVSAAGVVALAASPSSVVGAIDAKGTAALLDPSGVVLQTSDDLAPGAFAITALGNELLAVQGSPRQPTSDTPLRFVRFGGQRKTWSETAVQRRLVEPALAFNGTTTILIYTERSTTGLPDVIQLAVSHQAALAPTTSATTPISDTAVSGMAPALALGDNEALVAFVAPSAEGGFDVLAGGSSFAGARLRVQKVAHADNPVDVSITRGGDRYLVLWADVNSYWREGPVYAAILDAAHGIFTAPFQIGSGDRPAAAFDGDSWMVVWETHSRISGLDAELDTTTIARSGVHADARPLLPTGLFQFEPSIVWEGTHFQVLWAEAVGLIQRERIVTGVFDPDGHAVGEASVVEESLTDSLRVAGLAANSPVVNLLWIRGGNQLVMDHATILTTPQPLARPVVRPSRGGVAVLYGQGEGPLTLLFVAPNLTTGSIALPDSGLAWDFVMAGDSAVIADERPTLPSEGLGTSAVFVRGAEFRRRAIR